MRKNFKFFVPASKIEKSQDESGNEIMRISGVASTSDRDYDGEILEPSGFDLSYFKQSGYLNWHHMKTPEGIIGEPVDAYIKDNKLYIDGILYGDSKIAKDVYKLAETLEKNSSKRRLGYSIEGDIVEQHPEDSTRITRAVITGCAVTPQPKNPNSFAQIVKAIMRTSQQEDIVLEPYCKDLKEMITDKQIASLNKAIQQGDSNLRNEDRANITKLSDNLVTIINKAVNNQEKSQQAAYTILSNLASAGKNKEDDIPKAYTINDIAKEFESVMGKDEKALTTQSSSGQALTVESVDGSVKNEEYQDNKTNKAFNETHDLVFSNIQKQIELKKSINNRSNNITSDMTNPASELEKAYSALGITPPSQTLEDNSIVKGVVQGLHSKGETLEDIYETCEKQGFASDKIQKAIEEVSGYKLEKANQEETESNGSGEMKKEKEEEKEEKKEVETKEKAKEKDDMEKAVELVKAAYQANPNTSKAQAMSAVVKAGYNYDFAQMAFDLASEQMSSDRNTVGSGTATATQHGSPDPSNRPDVSKGQENDRISVLEKSLNELTSSFKQFMETSSGPKSQMRNKAVETGAVDRWGSSNNLNNGQVSDRQFQKGGGTIISIQDKSRVASILGNLAFDKGVYNEQFAKAAVAFESGGMLNPTVLQELESKHNIRIKDNTQ